MVLPLKKRNAQGRRSLGRLEDLELGRSYPSAGFTTEVLLFVAEYNEIFIGMNTCLQLILR